MKEVAKNITAGVVLHPVGEYSPSPWKALSSIPRTKKEKKKIEIHNFLPNIFNTRALSSNSIFLKIYTYMDGYYTIIDEISKGTI